MTVINVTDSTLKGSVTGPTFSGNVDGSKFTGSVTYTDTNPVPPDPPPATGEVVGFNPANGSYFTVGGKRVATQNANKSWSIANPDKYTLRFEVHQDDYWGGNTSNNRSELMFDTYYNAGTKLMMSYTVTIEPGSRNAAGFLDISQLHTTDPQSPPCPFTVQLSQQDNLDIVIQWPGTEYHRLYRSPKPVVRGQPMDLKYEMRMDADGSDGYLLTWLDGVKIVDYRGKIGANSPQQYYFKVGIYRGKTAETLAATFRNVSVTSS